MSLRRPLAVPPRRQGFFISHRPRLTTEGWPAGGQRTPLDAVEQFSGAGIPDRAQEGAHPGSFLAPAHPYFPRRSGVISFCSAGAARHCHRGAVKFPAASEPPGAQGKQGRPAYYFASAGIVFSMALPVGGSIVAKLSPAFFQAPRPPSI